MDDAEIIKRLNVNFCSPTTIMAASRIQELKARVVEKDNKIWHKGYPNHVYGSEWFIAITVWGDKVVLKALTEEHSYDYSTADETYIKKDKIKKWMQFPNSNFIPYCTKGKCPIEQGV